MYQVRKSIITEMERSADQAFPNECCGLLGGNSNLFTDYYPLTNRAEKPASQFFAAPEDIFQAMRQMRKVGQKQLGIYHSHPTSQAFPSSKDVEMAFYPEAIHFILSLQQERKLRAFLINNGIITNIDFIVIE